MVTFDQIDPEDWENFSADIVGNIVEEYLQQNPIDYVRLRWFFRRLAQVGHFGALEVVANHITELEPCLGNVSSYIASIQAIPPTEWKRIGAKLVDVLEIDIIKRSEYARVSVLSLFSKNEYIDHFEKLSPRFSSSDMHVRRELLLAAFANGQVAWLKEHKEDFRAMNEWQQMAYIYSVSSLPSDEKGHFLRSLRLNQPFENRLKAWAGK